MLTVDTPQFPAKPCVFVTTGEWNGLSDMDGNSACVCPANNRLRKVFVQCFYATGNHVFEATMASGPWFSDLGDGATRR